MTKENIKTDTSPRDHARNVGYGEAPKENQSNLTAPETAQTKARAWKLEQKPA